MPDARPEIDDTADAAVLGGLQPGDVILGVNGQSRPSATRLVEVLRSPDGHLAFEVRRAGQVRVIDVQSAAAAAILQQLKPYATRTEYPGAVASLSLSARYNWASGRLILGTLGGLFTRETRPSDMMGPIGILMVSGDAARLGFLPLLQLLAMISLNLGLLNLLPIPVLDGGHIALLALEGISRRDFSVRVKERLLATGFVLLMTLMGTVIYNDLMRVAWIERLFPWR
jgi:regulator of sigma E protease